MIHLEAITRDDFAKSILRKMAPPLGTFLPHYLSPSLHFPTYSYFSPIVSSHSRFLGSRSSMGRSTKHQPDPPETSDGLVKRDESLLLQVQRSTLCQGREVGNHDQVGRGEERRYVLVGIERVKAQATILIILFSRIWDKKLTPAWLVP